MEKKTWIERVVIVFNDDGTYKGGHQERRTKIIDDDGVTVIAEGISDIEPLDSESLQSLMPEVSDLMAQIEGLNAKLESAIFPTIDQSGVGVEPGPETPAVVVPESVEARRLLTVLDESGLLDQIEAYVAAQPRVVQINWDRAIYFRRDHELLNQAAVLLGMSSEQVDQMFIKAALIP